VLGLFFLPLPRHSSWHAERAVGRARGCTDGPALSGTPVGSLEDDETLSSRTISARWRYGPDLRACWSPASGSLQGPPTSPSSSPGTSAARARHWRSQPWWRHDRQSGGAVAPAQARASPCAGVPDTTTCGTGNVTPCGLETRWPQVSSGAC